MKFTTALTFAASASAATLQTRQEPSKQISEFSASCIAHSASCVYEFQIYPSPSLGPNHCKVTASSTFGELPAVAEASCEDNEAYTWATARSPDGGLRFAIWYALNSRSNITYCHQVQPAEIETVNGGAVQTETYIGPKDFLATWESC